MSACFQCIAWSATTHACSRCHISGGECKQTGLRIWALANNIIADLGSLLLSTGARSTEMHKINHFGNQQRHTCSSRRSSRRCRSPLRRAAAVAARALPLLVAPPPGYDWRADILPETRDIISRDYPQLQDLVDEGEAARLRRSGLTSQAHSVLTAPRSRPQASLWCTSARQTTWSGAQTGGSKPSRERVGPPPTRHC